MQVLMQILLVGTVTGLVAAEALGAFMSLLSLGVVVFDVVVRDWHTLQDDLRITAKWALFTLVTSGLLGVFAYFAS